MKPDACLSEIIVYIKFMALIDINTSTGLKLKFLNSYSVNITDFHSTSVVLYLIKHRNENSINKSIGKEKKFGINHKHYANIKPTCIV